MVLFVIAVGVFFVNPANWTTLSPHERRQAQELLIPDLVRAHFEGKNDKGEATLLQAQAIATFKMQRAKASGDAERMDRVEKHFGDVLAKMSAADKVAVAEVLTKADAGAPKKAEEVETEKWGMFAKVGLNKKLAAMDNSESA